MPRSSAAVEPISARQAIVNFLTEAGEPKRASEIVAAVIANPAVTLAGKTPGATISSVLTTEAKKEAGLFEKVSTGVYKLRAA